MQSNPPPIAPEALLRHADFIRRLVRPLLSDEAAVDDVAQETWVTALQRRPAQADSLKSWLGSVARRVALRRLRGDERRTRREQEVAGTGVGDDDRSNAAREVLLENVTRAVLDLAEPYRSTVMLRYFEGLGPKEIARRTGVPVATVASRLQRAHARIRERLDRDTDGGRRAWSAVASSLALSHGALVMSSSLKVATSIAAVTIGAVALWSLASQDAPSVPANTKSASERAHALAPPREAADEDPAPPTSTARVAPAPAPAPTPEPAWTKPKTGALAFRAVWENTRLPAVDRVFGFFPWDSDEPFAERIDWVTDENGEILLEEVAAGEVMIYGQSGGGGRATIEAGELTEYELVVSEGMLVTGVVVDVDGNGVDGARIWLSDRGNDEDGVFVTAADARGEFELLGVSAYHSIAAFAPGYAPSAPHRIEGHVGETVEVRLELPAQGGSIYGFVTDAYGASIGDENGNGGAVVRVEPLRGGRFQRPDGTWSHELVGFDAVCDVAGRFELKGLPLEPIRLLARAPGFAPFSVELTPTIEGTSERVTLQRAAIVFGTITNGEGAPLAGVKVQEGPYGSFASSFGRTRADGTFRLANLPFGSVELLAEDPNYGRVTVELELLAGEAVEWSPVMVAGPALVGSVVDEDGQPRAGFTVDALGSKADPETRRLWSEQVRTSSDGSFRFANCPDEELHVEVHDANYVLIDTLRGIHAGGDPLTIVVSDAQLPSAGVRGTIVDWEGEPVAATVALFGPGDTRGYRAARSALDTGDFEVGALPPGVYSLTLQIDDRPALGHPEIELAQDELLDLGEWRLPAPGRVEIAVVGHAGSGPYDDIWLLRQKGDVWGPPIQFAREDVDHMILWPGHYLLQAHGVDVCVEQVELDVVADELARVRLEPRPGAECTFIVRTTDSASEPPAFVIVSLVDEARKRSAAKWAELQAVTDGTAFTRRLPPGDFTALVRALGTELARIPFSVREDDCRIELALP